MNLDKAEKFLKSKGVDTKKYVIHDIKGGYLPQIPIALWLEEFAQERVKSNVVLDDVTPRLIFDEGIKYANELAEKEDKDVDLDVIGMIAKDYTRHVAHYIKNNVG